MEQRDKGETEPKAAEPAGDVERLPYEAPRVVRREQIVTTTLVSGQECVFDPPPC